MGKWEKEFATDIRVSFMTGEVINDTRYYSDTS